MKTLLRVMGRSDEFRITPNTIPSGAKARSVPGSLLARLKPCPFKALHQLHIVRVLQALLLAVAVCFSVGASDSSARYDHLNHQLMCSCGCGQVLGECNHVGCPDSPVQLAELRTAINAGMTDQQVLDSFAAKYGATVLAAPTTHGFDLVAWIAPFAVFLAALLGTILLIRHWSVGKKEAEQQASTPEMDAIRERIRRETGSEGSF